MSTTTVEFHESEFVELFLDKFKFRYQFVRLDGSMSIKKRGKIVDSFNNPDVKIFSIAQYHRHMFSFRVQILFSCSVVKQVVVV